MRDLLLDSYLQVVKVRWELAATPPTDDYLVVKWTSLPPCPHPCSHGVDEELGVVVPEGVIPEHLGSIAPLDEHFVKVKNLIEVNVDRRVREGGVLLDGIPWHDSVKIAELCAGKVDGKLLLRG